MDSWVVVVAAAVGAVPGLLTARWALRAANRTRRDDLVKAAVANLLASAMGATAYHGFLGTPAVRRSLWFRPSVLHEYITKCNEQLQTVLAAKVEFDLVIDHTGMHAAADALLAAVMEHTALATGTPPASEDQLESATETLKEARLNLVHEARITLPGLVQDRRRMWPLGTLSRRSERTLPQT